MKARKIMALMLCFTMLFSMIGIVNVAQAAEKEVYIFDTLTNGDLSTVGNISITPNITSGELYFEAKFTPQSTEAVELFRFRHNNNGSYSAYTPTIVKFEGGKVYARNNWNAVSETGYTYTAGKTYTVKVSLEMAGQWGPVYMVWITEDGGETKQVVWGNIVTGSTGFTTLGRIDFITTESTPFEYIKGYRLVEADNPSIFLNSPIANTSYVYGEDTISIEADAAPVSDSDPVSKVEFYDNGNWIATVVAPPYKFDWSQAEIGSHEITAKVYAQSGASSVSSPVTVKVEAPNARPDVSIISPVYGELVTPGVVLDIQVTASDSDGSISKVDFYSGTTLLDTKTAPSRDNIYTTSIENIEIGTYVLTAIATDNLGRTGASQVVRIDVNDQASVTENYYTYNFNDYSAAMGTTPPKNFGAWITDDGKMGGVAAPDKPEWGNCFKATSSFAAQIGLSSPYPSSGIIVSEGDFRFEGYSAARTMFHPRYNDGAGTIAQILSTSANEFHTKGANFVQNSTGYKFEENKWYHIKTFVDLDNHTYAVEVDGETILRMATISYGTLFNEVRRFNIGQNAGDVAMYIDNLSVYRTGAPSVTVTISTPYDNQAMQAGDDVTLTSIASTTSGKIEKVEYYNGDTLIGTATTSPYTYVWEDVPAGEYKITAKGYSTAGSTGTSNPVNLISKSVMVVSLFNNDMILQQNLPINVWGTGIDGNTVSVTFNGVTKTYTVADGKWSVVFDAVAADNKTKYTMTIADNTGFSQTISNIMMGEVWVCSGQSNMERAFYSDAEYSTESADANYPNIRLFFQTSNPQKEKQADVRDGNWKVCNASNAGSFSGVGFYFGREIHLTQEVPVGLIFAAVGGTQISSWMSEEAMRGNPELDEYRYATQNGYGTRTQYGLYNGMIAPLQPFGIKGVIWYQGESDAYPSIAPYYDDALSTMINDWRSNWGQDIDFHVVQLPNYRVDEASQTWHLIRDAQLKVANEDPRVGFAVTIDVGNSFDVHPGYKQPVGKRLALQARKITYGEDIKLYQGPTYKSMSIADGKVTLNYDFADGLKTSDSLAPKGFKISGADGVFYDATAEISGNQIILSAAQVSEPVAVRYAWENDPVVNLYNAADLPAVPFDKVYTGEPEEPDVILGDVTGDGNVNTLDRATLSRHLAKWSAYPILASPAGADVTGDGNVNTLDRATLSRHLAKWNGYETLD